MSRKAAAWQKIKNAWQFLAFALQNHPWKTIFLFVTIIVSLVMILMFSCDSQGPKMESKIKIEKTI